MRVTVVNLSVCLSTSDFEDGGVYMFEMGINVNYIVDNLSLLNVVIIRLTLAAFCYLTSFWKKRLHDYMCIFH